MEKIKAGNILKFSGKAILSGLAIYVVLQKIDLRQTLDIFLGAGLGWLVLAFVFFNLSKILSSIRLKEFFHSIQLSLSTSYNLRLYYVGMFYNLFLPGGIGGDGYKVYILNRYFKTGVKPLIAATLLDRISGMAALVFLALLLGVLLNNPMGWWFTFALLVSGLLIFPAYYLFCRLIFPVFIPVFMKTNFHSLGVQLLQVISAYFILKSLSVQELFIEYQVLFLISSVIAVLPFTIGGVGARELVFIFGANYFFIDRNTAVAFSIIFFVITALSSFAGIFLETRIKKKD